MLAGSVCLGGLCSPGGGPTPPDQCEQPQARAPIDAIEIGQPDGEPVRALPDGWVARVLRGPQGGAMLQFRLRVSGADAPACLMQTTTVKVRDQVLGSLETPLNTYADAPGSRVTRPLLVILNTFQPPTGVLAEVTAAAGGQSVTRSVWIDAVGD